MSALVIQKYYTEVHNITDFGGSKKETAIRFAFQKLLDEYASQKGLILIAELTIKSPFGNNITPDGTLKDSLRLDWGYWEAKDEADDINLEIEKKFAKGYPKDNIIFEDSKTAVLFQNGIEVARIDMADANKLDNLIKAFINYERPEIVNFHKAIELFKNDIPSVAKALRDLIIVSANTNNNFIAKSEEFLETCKQAINPSITQDDINEMMIQHILTADIFNTIFDEPYFHRENNIAKQLETVINTFFTRQIRENLLSKINSYYLAINATAAGIADHHEKQKFLKVVYESFYKSYNPKAADKLGVVYTPNEIVRFMIESTDYLVHKHFGKLLADKNVEILDPATGTGTFICDLIDYLPKDKLEYKYKNEIHANEVAILPYYIANLNIEFTYKQRMGKYAEFDNLCFVDTLDNMGFDYKNKQDDMFRLSVENAERIKRQNERKISVIIGNPPYNANQMNENDNNKNREYPIIDKRIKDTYIKNSTASNKANLYDMYTRFYRWAMDRIGEEGIITFITNNSFIDSRSFDGFRKTISNEYDYAYIINLGGNIRELSGKDGIFLNEKNTIFGVSAAVGIAIMFLVKTKENNKSRINYIHPCDIRATRNEKLDYLRDYPFKNISYNLIIPDDKNNWINQSNNDFNTLLPLIDENVKSGKGNEAIFKLYSLGVNTNRDEWVYDYDKINLENKMNYFIDSYNKLIDNNDKSYPINIKWSSSLKSYLERRIKGKYNSNFIKDSLFRPFTKLYHYTEKIFNHRLTDNHYQTFGNNLDKENLLINFNSNNNDFYLLSSNIITDLHFTGDTQYIPLYKYNEIERIENITDWGLERFRERYGDDGLGGSEESTSTPALLLRGEGSKHDLQSPLLLGEDLGEVELKRVGEVELKRVSEVEEKRVGEVEEKEKYYTYQNRPPILVYRARDMRKNPTKAESVLWDKLRNKKLNGIKFRRQHPIENFILDFYSYEYNLCIEIDGEIHQNEENIKYDNIRTKYLATSNIKVIRFTNDEVVNNTDYVLGEIVKNCQIVNNNTKSITKEDIFHYIYGVLHNPEYRKKYEMNLKREFPRIPFYEDFWKWANWGEKLMDLHINFEEVEKFDLNIVEIGTSDNPKCKLKADKDLGEITLDDNTIIKGIPKIAWEYKLGNRSALEWILDQYKEKKPKDPTIAEKFNTYKFSDYKEKVIDLIMRLTTVSVETMNIISEMEK